MDDERAVATRITWTHGNPPAGASNPQLRYQLENHLGSATLEVDTQGQIISYEEYFPYGGTALIAGRSASEVQLKQYRYSAKELDSITGFYYYGARYYAPWLGRWMSPDPAGTVDGLNLYAFVRGNPITSRDRDGMVGSKAKHHERAETPNLSAEQKKAVQRMDSIARLFDIQGTVATAAGFINTDTLILATNKKIGQLAGTKKEAGQSAVIIKTLQDFYSPTSELKNYNIVKKINRAWNVAGILKSGRRGNTKKSI